MQPEPAQAPLARRKEEEAAAAEEEGQADADIVEALFAVASAGELGLCRDVVGANPELHPARVTLRGHSLLHVATLRGWLGMVSWLLEAGADPNARDNTQHTPLHWACMDGHTACASALVQAGGDVHAVGQDALMVVARQIPVCVVGGRTPLHLATLHGHASCVRLLLQADPGLRLCKDNNGRTASDLARMYGQGHLLDQLSPGEGRSQEEAVVTPPRHAERLADYRNELRRVAAVAVRTIPNTHGNCCAACASFFAIVDGATPHNNQSAKGEEAERPGR